MQRAIALWTLGWTLTSAVATHAAPPQEAAPQKIPPQQEWEHARSAGGVVVHTREVPGSRYREFRATRTIPAALDEVVAWWRDASTYTSWIDSCVEARSVEREGIRVNYLKLDFPFPASDRDVVLRAIEIEAEPGRIVLESRSVEGLVPPVEGLVRMPYMLGRWEFRAVDAATTQVEYRQHMDPGGRLPSFIVNRATIDNPIGTLLGLARYAESRRSRK